MDAICAYDLHQVQYLRSTSMHTNAGPVRVVPDADSAVRVYR